MSEYLHCYHSFDAYYQHDSQILILGSFPSVRSRKDNFYYAHPNNRFWRVLEQVYHMPCLSLEDKKKCLKTNKIALYDVIDECDIKNSSDSSIRNIKVCDIYKIINNSSIKIIILNGKTAYKYFIKYFKNIDIPYYLLPSTSSANASCDLNTLILNFKAILANYL